MRVLLDAAMARSSRASMNTSRALSALALVTHRGCRNDPGTVWAGADVLTANNVSRSADPR